MIQRKFAYLGLLIAAFAQVLAGGQAGVTETVFNRRFIPTIKPGMSYEQVVKLAGAPGIKSWKGGRDSILTANFAAKKLTDATVLAPNKHTYLIESSGEVVDITK